MKIRVKKGTFLSKAAWIRSQPKTMPAAEVVKLGKAAGYEISAKDVHSTRYTARANMQAMGGKSAPLSSDQKQMVKDSTARILRKVSSSADFVQGLRLFVEETVREEVRRLMSQIVPR